MTDFKLDDYINSQPVETMEYKPLQYVNMPKPFQDAIGLPGIPLGFTSMAYGLSDSGKTDILLKIAAECTKQEILPIIIITENKMDKKRLNAHDLIPDKNCIIVEHLATLEDVFDYISVKVEDVLKERLNYNTLILWDSVASTPSKESFEVEKDGKIKKKYGPQKNASVIGYYNPIIMSQVSTTRQLSSPHVLGVFMLNQAYIKPPEFPGGMSTTVPNGGEKIWFPLALSLEIKEGQRHKAKIDGRDTEYALTCKLKVKKNHINGVYTTGEVVLAGTEMFENDEKLIKQYKESLK